MKKRIIKTVVKLLIALYLMQPKMIINLKIEVNNPTFLAVKTAKNKR